MTQYSVSKSVLERFYSKREPFVLEDEGATTWESVGAIFLTAVVSRSTLPEIVEALTRFPMNFVQATLSVFEEDGWWFSEEFARLTLAVASVMHSVLSAELDCLMEEFWAETDAETLATLTELRGGISFGGLRCARLQ